MAEVWDVQQLKLTWETCRDAPHEMRRGAAVAHGSVGYFNSWGSHYVFKYDSEKDDWSKLRKCPQKHFELVVINNLLTAVGGEARGVYPEDEEEEGATNRLVSFNAGIWEDIFPPMPTERFWLAVITVRNYLIAAGGGSIEGTLSTVEVMNTDTREWYTAASLPEPVHCMTATVCGGRLYLLGGNKYNNPTRAVFTCILDSLLPPHTNEAGVWQRIADAPMKDSTCTTLNGRVLAVGGTHHGTPTNAVHMYDNGSDSWQHVGYMSTARDYCLVVGLRDCIIAVGGNTSGDTGTVSVEVGYLQLSDLPYRSPPSSTAATGTGSETAHPRIGDRPKMWQLQKFVGVSGRPVRVVQMVSAKWEELALALHFDREVIRAAERSQHFQVEAACRTILQKWLDGEGLQPVTWETLMEALVDIEHGTLAGDLRRELEP